MLTDKQIEREKVFCYDWYVTRKMDKTPTYADAIVWADKTMIEKIRNWVTERYDLDFMGDFKDLLDYLKSLKEE